MSLLKSRVDATNERLEQLKKARKDAAKAKRVEVKNSRANRERRKVLVGEAVLARLTNGELDEQDFNAMMDAYLSRPDDRALFELD